MRSLTKPRYSLTKFVRRLLPGWLSGLIDNRFAPTRGQRIQKLLQISNRPRSVCRVLVWEPGGMTGLLDISAVVATALRLRGADVHLVMCDGAFSGCILREQSDGVPVSDWHRRCATCVRQYRSNVESFALPFSGFGDFVPVTRRNELRKLSQSVAGDEIFNFQHKGVDVGRLAASSVARNLKGKPMDGEDELLREYLYSALVCTEAAIQALDHFQPDYLLMSQAFYVDWGPALVLATQKGIPVVILTSGYLPGHFYFSAVRSMRGIDAHRLSEAGWQKRLEKPLSSIENERLNRYLNARYTTSAASDISLPGMPASKADLIHQLQLPQEKPVWGMFTHVNWDEVFNYGNMIFDTVTDWVLETIHAMASIRDVTWLIKIHPAEFQDKQRYGVGWLINEHFPNLPNHIRLIPSDSPINTYGLFSILDGGVTVFGTVGLELAVLGKPVILAGVAHYGGKGFTYDSATREEYFHLLNEAARLQPLSISEREKARQYAYSYFLERQFPLNVFSLKDRRMGQIVDSRLEQLLPGREPVIDMLCEQFIAGGDFILPTSVR